MKEAKRIFSGAGMNQDVDERMLQQGLYRRMQNMRVRSVEGDDGGAAKNVLGNTQLTNLNLINGQCIGKFADAINQLIYWFIKADNKDMLLEFNVAEQQLTVVLESTNPNGILNFDEKYLITGINKIYNGESDNDLFFWTDNINPPRMINIARAKTWAADSFSEDDISVIKAMPKFAPKIQLTFTSSSQENNLEEAFFKFAVRYKYMDNQYSPFSPYSEAAFDSKKFDLNFQSMENEGFVNNFNAVNVLFDSGDSSVVEVQLLIKNSNSNAVYLVEKFNKAEKLINDNEDILFVFSNSKLLTVLPDSELLRAYDNVPRLAKAQDIIGNRLAYGNYLEGYDLIDANGNNVVMDYQLTLNSTDLTGFPIPTTVVSTFIINQRLRFNLDGLVMEEGQALSFDIIMESDIDGTYDNNFNFIFNRDYEDANDLATDETFINFIENILSSHFMANFDEVPPTNGSVSDSVGFTINASTSTLITLQAPSVEYTIDNSPDPNTTDNVYWKFIEDEALVFYNQSGTNSSLKTNRSYEAGIIYRDKYGRATTALTVADNTLYIPQSASTFKNKIQIQINHEPPAWADNYQIVIKQNKGNYETIYTSLFYADGLYRYVRLEGANKDKVNAGDTLIVKSDLSGVVNDVTKVRVLDVTTELKDFIVDNVDDDGNEIIEESGVYMKIRPRGFDMNRSTKNAVTYEAFDSASGQPTFALGPFGEEDDSGTFVFNPIVAGSFITINIESWEKDKGDAYWGYYRQFIVNDNYENFRAWFEAEVSDFQAFEDDHLEPIQWVLDDQYLIIQSNEGGFGWGGRRRLSGEISVVDGGFVIFETDPEEGDDNTYYETSQTFLIENNKHTGNVSYQTIATPAIVELTTFNCFAMGNGAESYKIKDALNKNFLNFNTRPTAADVETYRAIRRFADITYSGTYNEESNQNGLNSFNLATANFKDDIDKKYGSIQFLLNRDTDLVVFQEDKIHKVLYGKDLLFNSDGSTNLTSTEQVLAQHIPFVGEYGISKNPESLAVNAKVVYFTDAKRGAVLRLSNDGLTPISKNDMNNFFTKLFKESIYKKKVGGYDPYNNEYVLSAEDKDIFIPTNTIPCTGSYSRTQFSGETTLQIDYGINTGNAGFTYNKAVGTMHIAINYNGTIYNHELPSDTLSGTIEFNKNATSPSKASISIASIEPIDFTINGLCVETTSLTVITVVVNDEGDADLTMRNRYRYTANGVPSQFKNFDNTFTEDYLNQYSTTTGVQGIGAIPSDGSTVSIQSYKGYANTGEFDPSQDRLGYLVTDTLYEAEDIDALVNSANYLSTSQTIFASGDIQNSGSFTLSRPNTEKYLYLIYDYEIKNEPPVAVSDSFNVNKGQSAVIDILANDSDPNSDPLSIIILTQPSYGTVTVNSDNTVTYVHDDSFNVEDSFTYKLNDGSADSNVATVELLVGIACADNVAASGETGIYETTVVLGTGTGLTGINYNAYGVPDRFQIEYDGVIVADSKYVGNNLNGDPPTYSGLTGTKTLDVFEYDGSQFNDTGVDRTITITQSDIANGTTEPTSGSGSLTFNKVNATPAFMKIIVTGATGGTAWNISNICPS